MNEVENREHYVAGAKAIMEDYNLVLLWPYFCTINAFKAMLNEVGLNRTLKALFAEPTAKRKLEGQAYDFNRG